MSTALPPITPDLRIGELLDAYPQLEPTLIGCAPEFARLRNPILRRTVARIATLEQAARIGGLGVRDLVRRLRAEIGQPVDDDAHASDSDACAGHPLTGPVPEGPPPGWLDESRVEVTIDADEALQAGQHPMGIVRQRLAALAPGRILAISASFRPVPLIDTLSREGYSCFSTREGSRYLTYLRREPGERTSPE